MQACCDEVQLVELNWRGEGEVGIDLIVAIGRPKVEEDHHEIPTT
jgi:hypothetical protein